MTGCKLLPQLDINNNIGIVFQLVIIFLFIYVFVDLYLFYNFFVGNVFKGVYKHLFSSFSTEGRKSVHLYIREREFVVMKGFKSVTVL